MTDEIASVLRLDTARHANWLRVRDRLQKRRDQLVRDLVSGAVPDHYAYMAVVGEIKGVDVVLAAIKKEFVNA